MNRRTRYFLVGALLVLVIGLGTGLVAYYGGNLPAERSAAESGLSYVPVSASALAYADVHAIMNSDFRQKLRQVLPSGDAKDELLAQTGIDVERDIDTVIAGFVPGPDAKSPEAASVVIVRGRFNTPQIETLAVNHGAVVETYRTVRLITLTHQPNVEPGQTVTSGDANVHSGGVAFLEPGLLALGTPEALKHAIDASADHQDVTKNADLMKLVTESEGAGNAWIVGQFDAVARTAQLPEQVRDRLPAVQWFSVTVNVNGGVSGVVRADTRDEQAADQLRDAVRGGLAMVRLVSGNDPKVDKIMNGLQLSGTGKTVALGFTLPPDVLDLINGVVTDRVGDHGPDRLEKHLKSIQK